MKYEQTFTPIILDTYHIKFDLVWHLILAMSGCTLVGFNNLLIIPERKNKIDQLHITYWVSLDSRRLGAGDSENVLFFSFFLFCLSLNQAKKSPTICCFFPPPPPVPGRKTYYFPAIFETFQLVSVDKKTMLVNSFPLLPHNTVHSQFITVPILSCCLTCIALYVYNRALS